MIFTDSHCHLTMSNAEANLAAARAAGVRGFVVPGTNLEDAPQAVAIARNNDDVWAAVGFVIFTFRDSVFECLAEDLGVELIREDDDTVKLMARRLYK